MDLGNQIRQRYILDDSDEDLDEEMDRRANISIWRDFYQSVYDSRYYSIIACFVGFYCAYQITIAPYKTVRPILSEEQKSMDALKFIRPVLSGDEIAAIHHKTMFAETSFHFRGEINDVISVRHFTSASKAGNFAPPQIFYDGVFYGLSWENSHNIDYYLPGSSIDILEEELSKIEPKPSFTTLRISQCNNSRWTERGLAAYYSFDDLRSKGWLSSDEMRPWKRTENVILDLARNLKMAYIYVWYPHRFGEVNNLKPHHHKVIIQEVIPTRTGIDRIKSSVTVWLSAINGSEPTSLPPMFKKAWSPDDHWTHYPFSSENSPRDEY